MIDNLELIKPLLSFNNDDEFYVVKILLRKKDKNTDKANHQSVRTIKTYYITSIEYLEYKYGEIKKLCDLFEARAYFWINKKSFREVSYDMNIKLGEKLKNNQFNQTNLFESCVGKSKSLDTKWVVDVDKKEVSPLLISFIEYKCKPYTEVKFDEIGIPNGYINKPKIKAIIPTANGYHLITDKFDTKTFKSEYPYIEIQKDNPTLLYFNNEKTN